MSRIQNAEKNFGFLALFPIIMTILDPYAFTSGGMAICDVLCVLMAVWLILTKKTSFYLPLLFVIGIELILSLLSFCFTNSTNTSMVLSFKIAIVFFLYLFVYSGIWMQDIKDKFFMWVEIIGIICAILAILQFTFASLGFNFYDGKLFLPLGEGSYFGGLYDRNTGDLRVHSFFEEPSYLAFFEIPITAHLVQRRKYVSAIICGLSCILSGSMIGVLGLIIILVSIVLLDSSVKRKSKVRLILLIGMILVIGIAIYSTNDGFRRLINYYFERFSTIEASSNREDSSFSQRIMGNILLFNEYNTFNKWVGLGFNQYPLYFGLGKDYSNDFVSTLLNFGYIGIISLVVFLTTIFKQTKGHGRVFAVAFLVLLAVDHAWFGTMFFYMLTWIMMKSDMNQSNVYLKLRY